MDLQAVRRLLQLYLTELRCELTGWDRSIPIDTVKTWIKKVDARIIKRIEE